MITHNITVNQKLNNILYLKLLESYQDNIRAIYIHIIADALGSISVLISSFLIEYYGLVFADPICSIVISFIIIYSTYPVLKTSLLTLAHNNDINEISRKNLLLNITNDINKLNKHIIVKSINIFQLNSDFTICELEIVWNLNKRIDNNIVKSKLDSPEINFKLDESIESIYINSSQYCKFYNNIISILSKFDINESNAYIDIKLNQL